MLSIEPNVSIALGTELYDLSRSAYFANFVVFADAVAAPATCSVEFGCDGATVSGQVKSHARHLYYILKFSNREKKKKNLSSNGTRFIHNQNKAA